MGMKERLGSWGGALAEGNRTQLTVAARTSALEVAREIDETVGITEGLGWEGERAEAVRKALAAEFLERISRPVVRRDVVTEAIRRVPIVGAIDKAIDRPDPNRLRAAGLLRRESDEQGGLSKLEILRLRRACGLAVATHLGMMENGRNMDGLTEGEKKRLKKGFLRIRE